MGNKKYSIKARIQSFTYAINGVVHVFKSEVNAQIHLFSAVLAILMGFYFDIDRNEWLWVSSAIALVVILEMVNTAIEEVIDLLHPEQHPKAGIVKDLVAGAVLIAAIYASVVGLMVFGKPCLDFILNHLAF